MRTQHTAHHLSSFPVYSSAFLSPDELILGGGGGSSRSGIGNKLRLYRVSESRALDLVDELVLEQDEDAPMSMDVHLETKRFACGINSSAVQLSRNENENCRVYSVEDNRLTLLRTQGTLTTGDIDHYQKVTSFSRDGTLLVAAGAHDLSLLKYPTLAPATNAIHIEKADIYDATFSPSVLVIATTVNLLVYALPKRASPARKKGKAKASSIRPLELLQTIEVPTLPGDFVASTNTFRAARFHPHDPKTLYTVVNTIPSRKSRAKYPPRPGFLLKWDTEKWEVTKVRKVGDRGVTCFDVSPNGKYLAFGSSDYTIGLVDANTLSPLLSILKAHEFPPTTLRFNPSSTLLVSGSADNSVRIVSIPNDLRGASWSTVMLVILALLAVLLAVLAHFFLKGAK